MKKLSFLWIVLAMIGWSACSCPDDEKTGELNLGTAAAAFLPYNGSETLVFINEVGANLTLQAPLGQKNEVDKLCYRTTCTEAKYNSPSSCVYYTADSKRYLFSDANATVLIDLLVHSEVYKYGTAEFYDALQVGFSAGTPSITGRHIIEARFTGPLDINTLGVNDFFQTQASLEINGQLFTDILVREQNNLAIYIEQDKGIIGFKDADHTWVLQQ